MRKVLTASSNENVISTVRNACKLYPSFFATDIFDATEDIIRYIDYELPEIKVIDFTSENIDCDKILQNIAEDTWLHYGGVIAVCKSHKQVEEIERRKNPNILAIQTIPDFQNHFVRILRILYQNQRFLFNRGMSDIAGTEESGSFIFGNDSMDCRFYTNFLVNYLYNTNRISDDDRFSLQMTFSELVTNALEHGNLEIDYATKTEWLNKGGNMIRLIQERSRDPRYAKRRIKISYNIGRTTSRFTIADDGNGFDWKSQIAKNETDENMLHGRG
ncbi:MAG: ATP-binding protein, partial [Treponema sp.]|nr:ATP-binding protein [Treponema sp.]